MTDTAATDSRSSNVKRAKLNSIEGASHVSTKDIGRGKWLSLQEITYTDPAGAKRTWEACNRTTSTSSGAQCVVIMATLKRVLKHDCIVLLKQYRPPLQAYSIEFVAGLIDENETPRQAAERELLEETGYTGIIKHISPATCLDPGTESCKVCLVTAEIDGDSDANKSPKPSLDETEFIEVILVPVGELLTRLNDFSTEGCVVDARTYTYAIAITQTTKERPEIPSQK